MSYQEERLQEIADAIREVKGTTEKIPATNFASEIVGLSVVKPSGIKTITENGDYDVSNYAWASVNVKNTAKAILGKWNITSGYYLEFDTNGTAKFGAGTQTSSGTYTVNDVTISVNIAEVGVVGDFVYNEDTDTITGTIFEEQFVLTRLVNIREKDVIGKWKKPDGTILFELKLNGVGISQSGLDFTYVIIGNTVSITVGTQIVVVLYDESSDTMTSSIDRVTLTRVQETATLITKEITENGTYKASDDGADGYSEVVVNVAGSGGGDATPKIYGVSWVNDASTTMTRTDDAVEMTYSITNGRVTSDFDKVFPYNQMKRTVINGNTFVFVPAMWFRVIADSNKKITSVAVSSVKGEGDNWYPTRPFYYGAYGASSDGTVLKSVSGVSRLHTITRADARQRAMAVGSGYHQRDLYSGTILMFLWWIEFATKNSASIMTGTQFGKTTGNTNTFYNEEDGNNFCVSGYITSTSQMVWHGIEDYIGNVQEWEDGITGDNVIGGQQYVSDNYLLYDDYLDGSKMSALAFNSVTTSDNCLEALGWDNTKPFLCQPIATRTDKSFNSGFCDFAAPNNKVVVDRGTAVPAGASNGVSCFARADASYAGVDIGCRLVLNV